MEALAAQCVLRIGKEESLPQVFAVWRVCLGCVRRHLKPSFANSGSSSYTESESEVTKTVRTPYNSDMFLIGACGFLIFSFFFECAGSACEERFRVGCMRLTEEKVVSRKCLPDVRHKVGDALAPG